MLCRLAAWYIWLVHATGRWTTLGGEAVEALWDRGEPFIAGCWHGRLLMMAPAWRRGVPAAVLVSRHRDGELVGGTVAHFGVDTVRGSSSKGGAHALLGMLHALKDGVSVGITPDGPRGPRMRARDGVVTVAQMSGRPIVPVSYAASRRIVLGTWDRFVVPLPFARGVYIWGEPIRVAREADGPEIERARLFVEEQLNRLTAEADRLVGHGPIAPDPAPGAGPGR